MNSHPLEKYAQVISVEMMEGLKNSAETHGITLKMEVAPGSWPMQAAKLFKQNKQ